MTRKIFVIIGLTASGKHTVAEFMLKKQWVKEILSFNSFIQTILEITCSIPVFSRDQSSYILDYENMYKTMLKFDKNIWIQMMENKINNCNESNSLIIVDCCTWENISWAIRKKFYIIALSPDSYIQAEFYRRKYNSSWMKDMHQHMYFSWNKNIQGIVYNLIEKRVKRTAVIRFKEEEKNKNMFLVAKAIRSLINGEPSSIW